MQRKFNSDDPVERFPFQEAYWEQAQALIEADEQRRRKRRRILFWWWFSGALLLGAGALYFWPAQGGSANLPVAGQTTVVAPSVSPATPGRLETAGSDGTGSTEKQAISANVTPENIENRSNTLEKGHSASGNQAEQLAGAEKNKNKPNSRNAAGRNQNTTVTNKTQNPSLSTGQNTPNPNDNSLPVASVAEQNVAQKPERTPAGTPVNAATNPAPGTDIPTAEKMAMMQALELPFLPAKRSGRVLLLKKMSPKAVVQEIKPVHDRRGRWVAGAAASTWKAGWGYSFGVSRRFAIDETWSWSGGLAARYIPLTAPSQPEPDSSDNITVQYRYSFGLERTESRRTPKSLFNLEMPIALHWQRGPFGLSAGVSPGLVLAARNKVVQTRETTLGGLENLGESTERGNLSGFRSGYFSAFATAEWWALPRLGLAVQGNYRPGSMLKPMPEVVHEKDFWYFDLGLRWKF